ncbi:MAG: tRNA (adenosine(37)-N6)-threonylcarbamoyltransferase complex dimerization subunit type 1 TsaB [Porphyromonadaceae bacterium]|nr:tRNA (adenosine(37)-N6)-threonylcarbamoyltransferase complex dimerization subunit type 1 TsaB [Porphyromonadaceae bacterium]
MSVKRGILSIETATKLCSAAYSVDGQILTYRVSDGTKPNHAETLAPFIEEILKSKEVEGMTPEAIAVSAGPGSYTGLRIGASTAKGLAFGYEIPMIAVPTLQIVAAATPNPDNHLICAMIDARRMEVYTALFDANLEPLSEDHAIVIDETFLQKQLKEQKIIFAGDGADKSRDIIQSSNVIFTDQVIYPTAMAMAPLANRLLKEKSFVDTAYWQPDYLKEYVAIVGKNKVLNNIK